jgi:hypothetical protein
LKDKPEFHVQIKRVVEFYCSELAIQYQQGMLEVVLPFLYLKSGQSSQSSEEEGLAMSYALFKQFVQSFLANILHPRVCGKEVVLPHMKCALQLTDLLLQYVDKELHSHLQKRQVTIEAILTRYISTLYSRCVPFACVFELWEIFLFERDVYFVFYFGVALLQFYRERLLKLKSMEKLVPFCAGLRIEGLGELADVYKLAIEVR